MFPLFQDLDIVHSEAKKLMCPIPVASASLQQFISGQSLGCGQEDDSQVIKVYERVTGASVSVRKPGSSANRREEGNGVGDLWTMEDGAQEVIMEVGDEPRHHLALVNRYTRVLKVRFGPNDATLAHRHAEDSLYFFLTPDGTCSRGILACFGVVKACHCVSFVYDPMHFSSLIVCATPLSLL